jgi:hypothetical protein
MLGWLQLMMNEKLVLAADTPRSVLSHPLTIFKSAMATDRN